MSEKKESRYTPHENLVLQADRSILPRRDLEPTGEPTSLYGKIDFKTFGDRARSAVSDDKKPTAPKKENKRAPKETSSINHFAYGNVLAATEDFEGLEYRPRTKETRAIYELILAFVQKLLGDISQDVLRGAVDEVLSVLKDDSQKDFDKKKLVESTVGPMTAEEFSQIVNLSKKITDFVQEDLTVRVENDDEVDQQEGVAVLFDEDQSGSDDDYYVKDADSDEDQEAVYDMESGDEENQDETEEEVFTSLNKNPKEPSDLIHPTDIDAFWLQRLLSLHFNDPVQAESISNSAFEILSSDFDAKDCENELVALFEYEKFDVVKMLTKNRNSIVWCTKIARAQSSEEKEQIRNEMLELDFSHLLDQLDMKKNESDDLGSRIKTDVMDVDESTDIAKQRAKQISQTEQLVPKKNIDLQSLVFSQGDHLMSNKKCRLPEGSSKKSKKGYEEIHVPPPKSKPMGEKEKLVAISSLPDWSRKAFKNSTSLNRIQSRVYPTAFKSDENMLVCAPTGAGKTNVAMLTMLREIGKHYNPETNTVNVNDFKIIYIAPMKALVAEMVGNFSRRLADYNIKVAELTGDRQLTKQQIAETQVIITTPEKYDIITRKATDRSYINLVRLIIIDEIHLLHDERGPVLESIVSRTLRQIEQTQDPVRLVGLSATLPNYVDVATFMRVNFESGMFFFDNSYRPCPLKQQFIGVTEKKAIKRFQMMNEITYEKIMEEAGKNQILVFVHSRKETVKTAKTVRDMCLELGTITKILKQDTASKEILQTEANGCKNVDLQDLLPYGFAVHHAGMTRADRTLVEDLFADGHIQVLVSTATLAWGVNLPAHSVIIKGTQVYSPEKGRWVELSPQDVLQMLGRAGRPQYDTFGEGIIITTHNELQYYLSLLNVQLPIESQFMSKLADNLNAEIVLGTIRNRQEAVQWLGYTYLYVRMLRNKPLYQITPEDYEADPYLEQKRVDLVHAAATQLDKFGLIKYEKKTGKFQSTELGKIASHYYISSTSMAKYNQHLKPTMTQIDLFRVFALSEEFKYIPVREEEKLELSKLLERVPIPVKEAMDEPTAKVNLLLQAYISQLKLEGFALMADMVYITQSAGRILRAIFEICLKRGWAQLSRRALDMCKMVDKRMWLSMNPLRQFKNVPADIIKRLERKEFPWDRYFDLNPQELGELAAMPKAGKTIHKFVHQFPKLDLQAYVQPITRSMIRIELTISPDFQYDETICGPAEVFWVLVEDCDSEVLLYQDVFVLKKKYTEEEHRLSFTVPLFDPMPPNYFISVVNDRWLHSETVLPISFKHMILPEKYPPHTELLDLQPLTPSSLRNEEFESIYSSLEFNPIQTQVFNTLYNSDDNTFIGAPNGSGKTLCSEFALLRLWTVNPTARCVYISPYEDALEVKMTDWVKKFSEILGGKNIVCLTGDTTADIKLLDQGDIIFSTPQKWDMLSRRWKQRKNIQTVGLFIADEVQLIGSSIGPTLEVIISRMRFIGVQTENPIRIVALSASLANARDLGDWIGANPNTIFNFHPSSRPIPLEISIQSHNIVHFASLMLAMAKPTFIGVSAAESSIVFVPSRKQCKLTAFDLLTICAAEGNPTKFLKCSEEELEPFISKIQDSSLIETLKYGIGFYHETLAKNDKKIIERLFKSGQLSILIASKDCCWSIPLKADLIIIMGCQNYEGKEHRYTDYPVTDVLQMMGKAVNISDERARCILMCQNTKKEFYKKFLYEALPVESHLDHYLHDHFNAEIVTKTIENKQDAVDYLTWTFFYRRLLLNPNYYNLQGDALTQKVESRNLSDHLSELVETTLEDLSISKCISIDEDEVSPLNLGMIASYYYINYVTIELFSMSLTAKTKMRGLLEIITAAAEFEDIPIRHHEEVILKKIYDRVPVKLENPKFNDPHFKSNLLLQAHFSRIQMPLDIESDLALILSKVIQQIYACVDVISSHGWLAPALAAMEFAQMNVQAIWDRDSPLRQVPHMTLDMIENLKNKEIETVFDFLEMDPTLRDSTLNLDPKKMSDIAKYVNRYPNVDVSYDLSQTQVPQGESVTVTCVIERDIDEDEELGPVIAPFYPTKKDEGWWLVVGDPSDKSLLAIKRTTLHKRAQIKLEFSVPEKKIGKHKLRLYFMCDSYSGADQEYELEIDILPAEIEEDEEEDVEIEIGDENENENESEDVEMKD